MDIISGLLSGIGGGIGSQIIGGSRGKQESNQAPYGSHVGVTDGDAPYDTMAEVLAIIGALAAGSVSTLIWQKTIDAQITYRWGFGSPTLPHNQGYMWFASLDSGTGFQVGVLRIEIAKSRQIRSWTVKEVDDTRLHGTDSTTLTTATPTDINTMQALPEKTEFKQVGEDSLMQLWYRAIAVPTTEDDVGFSIPVTIRH